MFLCSVQQKETSFISYQYDPNDQKLAMYWKDEQGELIQNFDRLKTQLQSKKEKLRFAMNGGMFQEDFSPLGLYVENGIEKQFVNLKKESFGNFYMEPNGIFYINKKNQASICTTQQYNSQEADALFATQSGPMLISDGNIHPKFRKNSASKFIRNGVGLLPNGQLLFAISTEPVTFYDFAFYFQSKGCENALYFDGYVSQLSLPEKGVYQKGLNYGVIIGITE